MVDIGGIADIGKSALNKVSSIQAARNFPIRGPTASRQ